MADSLRQVLVDMCHGMRDAVVGATVVFQVDREIAQLEEQELRRKIEESKKRIRPIRIAEPKKKEPKILTQMLKCSALNGGVVWASIEIFHQVIMPVLQLITSKILGDPSTHSAMWMYLSAMLSATFSAFWVLPVFILSRLVSSLWYQEIADAAYRKNRGRPKLPNISMLIADLSFSILIQTLFLLQSLLVGLIPITGVGQFLVILHNCLLYSLYAFEYKWFNMGWQVHIRLSYLESNWPYFAGFGLPLVLLTMYPSSYVVSSVLFAIMFPFFIISGNEAKPPKDKREFTIRIFAFVVKIANMLFRHSVKKQDSATSVSSRGS